MSESPNVAIRVQDLHIKYRTVLDKKQTLRGIVSRKEREKRARNVRVVHAVRGITFDVPKGSVLGIVGPNGAGKSTLLRAIAGILPPEEGRIEVAGHVSTLLALGLGFNQALSGRENIEVGGLAAGLTKPEVRAREDEIIEFAGIGDFIDMPMRTYSSGMKGRLAFAVSTSMSPEILLIDEALSAGDAEFKKRAAARMHELCGQDRTIVLVSHGLGTVRELADTAMWMRKGECVMLGDPNEVVSAYTTNANVGDDVVANED